QSRPGEHGGNDRLSEASAELVEQHGNAAVGRTRGLARRDHIEETIAVEIAQCNRVGTGYPRVEVSAWVRELALTIAIKGRNGARARDRDGTGGAANVDDGE